MHNISLLLPGRDMKPKASEPDMMVLLLASMLEEE